MGNLESSALQLFVDRLSSRSIITTEEKTAILGLQGKLQRVATHMDVVQLAEQLAHSCLVAEGLVGRFAQSRDGARQITGLHIQGDMADLLSW